MAVEGSTGTDVVAGESEETFRDHLGTADKSGRRLWLFPKRPEGKLYQWRTWFSWLQLGLMFGAPFVKIHGEPLLMLNIIERKFVILGQVFWPQDTYLFMLGMLCFFVFIILFTAVYGRVWCGWLCPQTIFLEMLFRKVDFLIDGDSSAQKALQEAPMDGSKLTKRILKHGIFLALSFLIGNIFLAYIIGSDALIKIITDPPAEHIGGLTVMLIFAGVFYWIYAFFREQICCFLCPYGRLQSVLVDENTILVAYDYKRGEPRDRFAKGDTMDARQTRGTGNCINCGLCTKVCPTGIDIRNGQQLECINCTACIDACNFMMEKVGLPRNLIRYASQTNIEQGSGFRWTPRVIGYTAILAVLVGVMAILLVTRQDVEVRILRQPGQLGQVNPDGTVTNLYSVDVVNKTDKPVNITFKFDDMAKGTLKIVGGDALVAKPGVLTSNPILVTIPSSELHEFSNAIELKILRDGKELQSIRTNFVSP